MLLLLLSLVIFIKGKIDEKTSEMAKRHLPNANGCKNEDLNLELFLLS